MTEEFHTWLLKLLLACMLAGPAYAQTLLPFLSSDLSDGKVHPGAVLAADCWSWERFSFGPNITIVDVEGSDPLVDVALRLYWRAPLPGTPLTLFSFLGGGLSGVRHLEGTFASGLGVGWKHVFLDLTTYRERHHSEQVLRLGVAVPLP